MRILQDCEFNALNEVSKITHIQFFRFTKSYKILIYDFLAQVMSLPKTTQLKSLGMWWMEFKQKVIFFYAFSYAIDYNEE